MQSAANSDHDVIIVGAGLIGLAVAWRLRQRGLDVIVLERGIAGREASNVAAGMLAPVTEVDFGERPLLDLNLAGAARFEDFVIELEDATGSDLHFRRGGALYATFDRDEADEVRRLFESQRSLGLPVEWLTPSACRALEPGLAPHCAGGAFASQEAQVDPRAIVSALLVALRQVECEIEQQTEIVGTIQDGERITGVIAADGRRFRAGEVVLAAGSWSGADWLPEVARPPVRPVKGQLLRLRSHDRSPPCGLIVRTPRVYIVSHPDGSVVIGASVEERGFDQTVTAGETLELLREAYRAVPEIAELELTETLAGLRPGTPDNAPLIGRSAVPGLILATGHYRNGVLLTPITAAAIASLLTGEVPALAGESGAFSPTRFAARSHHL